MRAQKVSATSSMLEYLIFSIFVGLATGLLRQEGCYPASCGQLQTISYPFRLKGSPVNCGDTNYELLCDGNRTVLELYSGKYYVHDIFYENSTIKIVDASLASGNCSLPLQSLSTHAMEYSSYYHLNQWKWASFVKCSKKINNNMYQPVSCLSQNGAFVYVVPEYTVAYLATSCSFLSITPLYQPSNSLQTDFYKLLQDGFFLSWASGSLSPSKVIHDCLGEAKSMFNDRIGSKNILSKISSLVKGEMHFLACLEDYSTLGHKYKVTFRVAVAIMVVIEIAQLLIVLAILGRFVFAPLTVLVFLAHKFQRAWASVDVVEKFLRNQQALSPTRYAYTDIIAMTNHFKEKLGQGGFGSVFRGELPGGHLVAVKMLGNSKCSGDDFINEVSTIGRIHHLNVVRLVGFCSEGSKRALVYEHMPNGSLDKYIFSSKVIDRSFSLEKRNEIALGVARGIDYLHRGCDMRILHFDIKPHNILLDQNFTPKVSDFGLAKLYPKDYSIVSISAARGTIGYIAPELISRNFGVISHKSDVYSFGMLLLEMAGGRRNLNSEAESSSQLYYPSWIYDQLSQAEMLKNDAYFEIKELERKLCLVGLWCIQIRPSDRPSMRQVVEMLESDVDSLQMPPKPFLSINHQILSSQSSTDPSEGLSVISED